MREPNQHLSQARQRKAALLPRAAALAGEGRSYQEIATALGIAKSTVCAWLRDRPLGRAAAKALGTPRMTARLAARYESAYHRALREWNRSRTDRRTESVETIAPAEGSPTTKTTVRTEPRIGSAACLGKALAALQALERLHCRERLRQETLAEFGDPAGGPAAEGPATQPAAGNEVGLMRAVTTRITPSGTRVRTVVTTRPEDGLLTELAAARKELDEKCRALEPWLKAAADALPDEAGVEPCRPEQAQRSSGISVSQPANSDAQTPELRGACSGLRAGPEPDSTRVRRSAALPNEVLQERGAGGRMSENRGQVHGDPAKTRRDWRKSFVPMDLRLNLDEIFGVPRSATLPNEVLQKRGHGKARGQRPGVRGQGSEGRGRRSEVGGRRSEVTVRRPEVRGHGSGQLAAWPENWIGPWAVTELFHRRSAILSDNNGTVC